MRTEKHQNYLQGALILSGATIVVKIIGALFKIPLANILGAVGMSYFVTAYDLFTPIYALTVTGLGVAVSKQVAEYTAVGRERSARRVLLVALAAFALVGIGGSLLITALSDWFVRGIHNALALEAVRAIGPAVFFSCISAAFRGYYQGRSNMIPTAVSQVVEAAVKLAVGTTLSYWTASQGLAEFAQCHTVWGAPCASADQAVFLVLPRAAAAAVVGVTVSTLAGCAYIALRHLVGGRAGRGEAPREWHPDTPGLILRRLAAVALPVSLGAVVINLTSLIDLGTVMNRIQAAMDADLPTVLAMYQGLLPRGMAAESLPEYLYGCYSGLAMSIFNLVPAVTTAFGISVLPAVSASWACGDATATHASIRSVLRLTLLVALPAGLGISVLSGPILELLFAQRGVETVIIAPVLSIMGISAIFVSLAAPVNSMLQAVGRVDLPVKLMACGALIKLSTNYFLVARPALNIQGVPYGTLLCYVFLIVLGLWCLCRTTRLRLGLFRLVAKPLVAAVLCAVAARTCYDLLARVWDNVLLVLPAVCVGGMIYLAVLFLTGGIEAEDARMLPGGEKILKTLEKWRLLG